MRSASYLLSLCLHAALFMLIWFWPASKPIRLDAPPVMISLVEGAPGGNRTPSPILGHMGEPNDGPLAPTAPAPQQDIAAPAQDAQAVAVPKEAEPEIKKPEPVKHPEPPKPEPEKAESVIAPKKEDKPKPEPKKEEPKPEPKKEPPKKEEPKKEPPKKEDKPKPVDPIKAALAKAAQDKKRNASSREQSGDRGNSVERALAQLSRKGGGTRGGGGGEGDGPGGGGLYDVYLGQVMLAVRPNWGYASPRRENLACVVNVKVDMQGKVSSATVTQGSGNPQFDASVVNAVHRTSQGGQFPIPPNRDYMDLDLVFSFNDMMGR